MKKDLKRAEIKRLAASFGVRDAREDFGEMPWSPEVCIDEKGAFSLRIGDAEGYFTVPTSIARLKQMHTQAIKMQRIMRSLDRPAAAIRGLCILLDQQQG